MDFLSPDGARTDDEDTTGLWTEAEVEGRAKEEVEE